MDGIIFDVDGTLWDSVEVVAESWNLAIKENSDLEPNLNREILQELFGKTMDETAILKHIPVFTTKALWTHSRSWLWNILFLL